MNHTSAEMEQQAIRELIQQHYPDAHRITVEVSATGAGRHLRWHYSEDLIAAEAAKQERHASPAPSNASSALVDDDGDSLMGDEEERPQTPSRLSPYDPGSVVLTPKKELGGRGLRREPRIGGGFDWWHDHDGVEERVTFLRDGSRSRQVSPMDRARLGPDALRLLELVEAQRDRYSTPASGRAPSPFCDDDALSVASSTEATVIVDLRNPTKQTLFTNEMPIVRQPSGPDEYDYAPGPSSRPYTADHAGAAIRAGLSTIQEEGSGSGSGSGGAALRAWQPKAPEVDMRVFRDKAGNWVRQGSLGPECDYHIDRKLLPPRVDVGPAPEARAGPSRRGAVVQRTDTEPAIPLPVRKVVRLVPVVEIPMRNKAPRGAPPPPAPAPRAQGVRRSERLRNRA